MSQLKANFEQLLQQIDNARNLVALKTEVRLVAVSKSVACDKIDELYQYGQRDFGESYATKLVDKAEQLKHLAINWHFIGNLQSNKIKLIAKYVSWVQSIEKLCQVELLAKFRPTNLAPLNCLIQINPNNTKTQHGLSISNLEQIIELADAINKMPNLRLRGLMAIASNTDNIAVVTHDFMRLRQLFDKLKLKFNNLDCLSMGMSDDFNTAILHGATMVRIGANLFGSER